MKKKNQNNEIKIKNYKKKCTKYNCLFRPSLLGRAFSLEMMGPWHLLPLSWVFSVGNYRTMGLAELDNYLSLFR